MMLQLANYYYFLALFILWPVPKEPVQHCKVAHKISIKHPGISLTANIEKVLFESKCTLGKDPQFYMDVESVVCGDSQCRIDTLRIFWNELGFYTGLTLPAGVQLEKAKGASFTELDYQKLDSILSDRKSGLKDVYKEEVTGSETSEGADALSGATIILDKKSYVKGAVWTCYTLWHWANGDINGIIRNITGDVKSVAELREYLTGDDYEQKIFALQQLTRRKVFDNETFQLIIDQATIDERELLKLILDYIEKAPSKQYYPSIEQVLTTSSSKGRLLSLNSLLKTTLVPPKAYFARLIRQLGTSVNYQEIQLVLQILNQKNIISPDIVDQLLPMLEHDNFIIARSVYWFLQDKQLTDFVKNRLETFGKEQSDKL